MSDTDVRPNAPNVYWRPHRSRRLSSNPAAWALIVVILVLALVSLFGEDGLGELVLLTRQRDRLAAEVDALGNETVELEARLQALREDPEALEALARERYNMQRAGEQVIRVVPEAPAAKAP